MVESPAIAAATEENLLRGLPFDYGIKFLRMDFVGLVVYGARTDSISSDV